MRGAKESCAENARKREPILRSFDSFPIFIISSCPQLHAKVKYDKFDRQEIKNLLDSSSGPKRIDSQ
jgi:hypothetical protein